MASSPWQTLMILFATSSTHANRGNSDEGRAVWKTQIPCSRSGHRNMLLAPPILKAERPVCDMLQQVLVALASRVWIEAAEGWRTLMVLWIVDKRWIPDLSPP
jgi:hypothetical protein